jgi:hypothetical protein
MNLDAGTMGYSLISSISSVLGFLLLQRFWRRRYESVRKELEKVSEDLSQIVELQSQFYERMRRDLTDLEGKVLDLAVPSSETPLPLQRRHQVITLARKGISSDEIARRLNMPKGEAELILSLRKYTEVKTAEAAGSLKTYARA